MPKRKCKKYKSGAERHIFPKDVPDRSEGFGSAKVIIEGIKFDSCSCGKIKK